MVNAKGLQEMGFSLVIFPGGVVRAMAHAAAAFYATLMADGGSDAFRNRCSTSKAQCGHWHA